MKPASAVDVLTLVDQKIAAIEAQLTGLRAARQLVVEACGITAVGQTAPSLSAAVPKVARAGRRVARKAAKVAPPARTRGDATLTDKVLVFLQRQVAPVRMGAIKAAVKGSGYALKGAVAQLVDAGEIVTSGTRAGTRLGTPAVMRSAKEEV